MTGEFDNCVIVIIHEVSTLWDFREGLPPLRKNKSLVSLADYVRQQKGQRAETLYIEAAWKEL